MDDRRARLLRCFSIVFPELSGPQAEAAAAGSVSAWDSVATVTLVAVIEEEFGCTVELDEYEQLTSFAGCLRFLESK